MISIFEKLNESSTQYDIYLSEHISNVVKGFEWIRENAPELLEGTTPNLEIEIENHDASKYSDEEYDAYDNYFYGHYSDDMKSQVEYDFDVAWNHHQKNNPHHWQYW